MREVISITQPKVFIAENVKGLTSLGDAKETMKRDFSTARDGGYLVIQARVLLAAKFGVPQGRERVIFYGFSKNTLTEEALRILSEAPIVDDYDPYPKGTHSADGDGTLLPFVTAGQCLEGLPELDMATDASQRGNSKAKYMGRHCQGQTEIDLNYIGPTIRSEHHGNIEYCRLSVEHGETHVEELNRGLWERMLTVMECARIQTFPDDYDFILPAREWEQGRFHFRRVQAERERLAAAFGLSYSDADAG